MSGDVFARRLTIMLAAALLSACGESTSPSGHQIAALMQIVSGDAQQAVVGTELANPLVVKVLDSAGAAVSGQLVNFRVVSGGGSVFAGSSITNTAGLAQERWTLGTSTADSQRVEARAVDNVTGAPLTFAVFKAVPLPGPPASLVKVAGDSQSAVVASAVLAPPAVRVADRYGNPVAGITVAFAVASGGGSVAPQTQTTTDSGIAAVTAWTLGTVAGANTLNATVTGLSPVVFTANGLAGAPASVATNAGDNQSAVAGSAVPIAPSVIVKDAKGNVNSGVFVTFTVAGGGGSLVGGVAATNAAGIAATTSWTLGPTAGINTATATVASLPAITFTATGVAGPAALIAVAAGDNQTATVGTAVAIPPAATVTDRYGNPVAGVIVTFAVTNGGGSITGATQATNLNGVATVGSWTLGTIAGANRLFATASSIGVSISAIGTAGPPAEVGKQQGDSQVAVLGTTLGQTVLTPPAVRVTDVYGNLVPNANVTFAVASGGGSVIGGSATTDASGIALVGAWIVGSTTGTNTLTAMAGGAPPIIFTATGTRLSLLAPGGDHTCAIGTGNAVYCWGADSYGELGNNTAIDRLTPTLVVGGTSLVSITAGYGHTCGLTSAGAAYCWGLNGNGQLGNGTTANSFTPTPLTGGLTFASLSAGWYHVCALSGAGAAYCWGDNEHGELGDGTTTSRPSPTAVSGGLTFSAIVAGYGHTCGLTSAGTAYCWGVNESGEVGDGTTINRSSPTPVSGNANFTALAAGEAHTCGLSTTGVVLCWGNNSDGQLGDGTQTDRLTPTPMVPGLTIVAVTAGAEHTCGLTNTGAAYFGGTTTSVSWGATRPQVS